MSLEHQKIQNDKNNFFFDFKKWTVGVRDRAKKAITILRRQNL